MSSQNSMRIALDQILTILHVNDSNLRERMIDELEQVIQTKVMLLSLKEIPLDKRQRFSKLSPAETEELLRQHVGVAVIERTFQQATEQIIPDYIAELARTASEEQKKQIQRLVISLGQD